jgi:uncharacterized membrane protein
MRAYSRTLARRAAFSAVVGALYAALTVCFAPLGFGLVQFRFAEALCLLPFYAPETVPGLFLGCLLANLFSPFGPLDIVGGSLATLLAALAVARVRRRALTPVPVVLLNALLVGGVLAYELRVPYVWAAVQVGFGELAVCAVLGLPLLYALSRVPSFRRMFPRKFTEDSAQKETV